MDYWEECVKEAFEDEGIAATDKQISGVVGWVEGAHENYGMAHGHDCISNLLEGENKELKRKLKDERDKVLCEECNGKGSITHNGPCHSATSSCWKCRGEGRYLP